MDRLTAYDLLVIDECHQRGETAFEQNTLTNLLDRRYDARKCTILIANQSKAEFSESMGDSVVSPNLRGGRDLRLRLAELPQAWNVAWERRRPETHPVRANMNCPVEYITITFTPEGTGPPTDVRIRRPLKSALRAFGLRCIDVAAAPAHEADTAVHPLRITRHGKRPARAGAATPPMERSAGINRAGERRHGQRQGSSEAPTGRPAEVPGVPRVAAPAPQPSPTPVAWKYRL